MINTYRILVGKPAGKLPLEIPRCIWEDNIKINLKEIGGEGTDWIRLDHDRARWRALVNNKINKRAS
jgi:hypothetical protein